VPVEQIYRDCRDHGIRYARRIVGAGDAEDRVQDAILDMYMSRDYLRDGNLKGYFFRALCNRALMHIRRFGRRFVLVGDEEILLYLEELDG